MTFLSNLGITEILCSFSLVLEENAGKDIPESSRLEFPEKFLANSFAVSDAEDHNSRPLNRRGTADSSLIFAENTISNAPEIMRAKFLGSDKLFCFISISLSGSFKTPFETTTSLPEIYFGFRRFILLVQTIKVISMSYDSSKSSSKP